MFKKVKGVLVSIVPAVGFAANQAYAAVPTEVTTALTDMKADALVVAGAFLIAIIAIIAFKMMRKGA